MNNDITFQSVVTPRKYPDITEAFYYTDKTGDRVKTVTVQL